MNRFWLCWTKTSFITIIEHLYRWNCVSNLQSYLAMYATWFWRSRNALFGCGCITFWFSSNALSGAPVYISATSQCGVTVLREDVILMLQWSCSNLAKPNIRTSLDMSSPTLNEMLQSYAAYVLAWQQLIRSSLWPSVRVCFGQNQSVTVLFRLPPVHN